MVLVVKLMSRYTVVKKDLEGSPFFASPQVGNLGFLQDLSATPLAWCSESVGAQQHPTSSARFPRSSHSKGFSRTLKLDPMSFQGI